MRISPGIYPVITLVAALGFLSPVFAAETKSQANGRYEMSKTADGIIRLDTKTGEMAICTYNNALLKCRLGADEGLAYQREISMINEKLAELQKRLATLEKDRNSFAARPKSKAREEEDFDRALKFADKAFRHFFNLMQDMKRKPKKDAI